MMGAVQFALLKKDSLVPKNLMRFLFVNKHVVMELETMTKNVITEIQKKKKAQHVLISAKT